MFQYFQMIIDTINCITFYYIFNAPKIVWLILYCLYLKFSDLQYI